MAVFIAVIVLLSQFSLVSAQCPDYTTYSTEWHPPGSGGVYNLSYMRPAPACRTFNSSVVENTITQLTGIIKDPDLKRLFENSYPNTLDTAIKWKGYAANDSTEELTFIITGDINAMWLRDSANQMQSYLPLLNASSSPDSLASLYRGVINLQARYLLTQPFCESFQAPTESGIPPQNNTNSDTDTVYPPFNNETVFECKYELDSLAAFLEISSNYYSATKDITFFTKYQWVSAVQAILNVANAMLTTSTYTANGSVAVSPYTWERETNRASETTENSGLGNPVQNGTGLIRSFFRPSDDATIFQFLIPSNMMFSAKLALCAPIMSQIPGQQALANEMQSLSSSLRSAITDWGIINHPKFGHIYAYEVDGYGGQNIMDDANVPSLLSAPFIGYLSQSDSVYQNTRSVLLSAHNPYFMRGPVINAIGGAHDGPGFGWPMASIVRILTSDDDAEITQALQEIVSSTDQLGLIHESINTFNVTDWTRQW
jgi:meiotically up-regulated gene 157 (Mug157) protein